MNTFMDAVRRALVLWVFNPAGVGFLSLFIYRDFGIFLANLDRSWFFFLVVFIAIIAGTYMWCAAYRKSIGIPLALGLYFSACLVWFALTAILVPPII